MTLNEAIKILSEHQKWRRGGDGEMTDPTKLGEAIDIILNELLD